MLLDRFVTAENKNCYCIACEFMGDAMIVDPVAYDPRIGKFLSYHKLQLRYIFLTHFDASMKSAIGEIKVKHGGQVILGVDEESGDLEVDLRCAEGNVVMLGRLQCLFLHAPGDSPGQMIMNVLRKAFVGNALSAGRIGGMQSKKEFRRQLKSVRGKIFVLGDDVELYPATGPSTTVAVERYHSPVFR